MDVVEVAGRFGIDADRAVRYNCDRAGIALNCKAVGQAILTRREKSAFDRNWGERIREDDRRRGKDLVGFHSIRLTYGIAAERRSARDKASNDRTTKDEAQKKRHSPRGCVFFLFVCAFTLGP